MTCVSVTAQIKLKGNLFVLYNEQWQKDISKSSLKAVRGKKQSSYLLTFDQRKTKECDRYMVLQRELLLNLWP